MTITTLGFIGAGNMAGAIIKGLLSSDFNANQLLICDSNPDQLTPYSELGCQVTESAEFVMRHSDAVVLAIKPQVMKDVLTPLQDAAQTTQPLIISVAAGIGCKSIDRWLGGNLAIIRCMPNTPALLQLGAAGLFANEHATSSQKDYVETMLRTIGIAHWVENEELMHAVTAVSGSGPAYFFGFAEAMLESAKQQGLDEAIAADLIAQTMAGAAKMIQQKSHSPAQLRQQVTSPKGTTEKAMQSFSANKLDEIVHAAMEACYARSVALSDELDG